MVLGRKIESWDSWCAREASEAMTPRSCHRGSQVRWGVLIRCCGCKQLIRMRSGYLLTGGDSGGRRSRFARQHVNNLPLLLFRSAHHPPQAHCEVVCVSLSLPRLLTPSPADRAWTHSQLPLCASLLACGSAAPSTFFFLHPTFFTSASFIFRPQSISSPDLAAILAFASELGVSLKSVSGPCFHSLFFFIFSILRRELLFPLVATRCGWPPSLLLLTASSSLVKLSHMVHLLQCSTTNEEEKNIHMLGRPVFWPRLWIRKPC